MVISRRQTTFWEFTAAARTQRVHFVRKFEWRFVTPEVPGFQIVTSHPVLIHHQYAFAKLYATSACIDADRLAVELDDLVGQEVGGWRQHNEFFNCLASPADVLRIGYGLIAHGPAPLITQMRSLLADEGVGTLFEQYERTSGTMKALLAGNSYVLAQDFHVEDRRTSP
ncbi:MAG: hypothetical protein EON54_26630 [Alcaligenaceae bacterium]|nr:MAG: hypothetical protein EON54_26630 [Alcaligenaceae bacterium]